MCGVNSVVQRIETALGREGLAFARKPLVIGGMAMEYYGLRPSGADIDLVVADEEYQALARLHPGSRKDIYGDLGVVLVVFEIWRSIALLDYAFLGQGALDEGALRIVSLDRLLLMRVCAMEVPKYRRDLELIKQRYYERGRNAAFLREAETHIPSYEQQGGVVFGGRYADAAENRR